MIFVDGRLHLARDELSAWRDYYGNPLLIRAVWLYRPSLSPVISVILQWDGLRFRSSLVFITQNFVILHYLTG